LKTFRAMRSSMMDDTQLNLKWLYFCYQLILGFGTHLTQAKLEF